ncbi:SURF1 family protein [Porphyrobacter sp. YT40]|uniref:SURF1 family protein n=1 Tax=Porphyrobacter sp. YT40 TaxID=2547601 RepID=UPI001143C4A7|nr:SURF1 family protein [Porphyrobacter sp. YT40]QDH35414.1 SURF1 family protein [Porphyrobacter sp. YT40]
MTARRVPIFSTIMVIAAVLTMVGLGIWQLGRRGEKEALIARYEAAISNAEPVPYPLGASEAEVEAVLYRRSAVECLFPVGEWRSIAGRNAKGASGIVHIIGCGTTTATTENDEIAYVQAGWSRDPNPPQWNGGTVTGRIAPNADGFARLIADPPLAGLEPNAAPDPGDLPNNHLAYAVQWFFFALTALVIYVLALRRRRR